jgi:DNA ligase (NAD+)
MSNISTLAAAHNWNIPLVCPICKSDFVLSDNHCQCKCSNDFCPSKFAGRINKWTNVLEIKEFGNKTINILIENGIIETISSLYTLDLNKIASLDRFGKRSAEKMKKQIDTHKEMTLAKFIAGYNIEGVGEKVINNIIQFYSIKKFEDFFKSDSSQRFVCDGVGSTISKKLHEGLKALKSDMEKTLQFVTIKAATVKKVVAGSLGGKSFCFTGAASRPRKELWNLVETNGGVVFEGVKAGLDYLVMADPNSKSSKAEKARKLGINLISEDDFVKMCG